MNSNTGESLPRPSDQPSQEDAKAEKEAVDGGVYHAQQIYDRRGIELANKFRENTYWVRYTLFYIGAGALALYIIFLAIAVGALLINLSLSNWWLDAQEIERLSRVLLPMALLSLISGGIGGALARWFKKLTPKE